MNQPICRSLGKLLKDNDISMQETYSESYGWWEYNIKMNIAEIGFENVKNTELIHNSGEWKTFVTVMMSVRVP
jgi:hypothetical protein